MRTQRRLFDPPDSTRVTVRPGVKKLMRKSAARPEFLPVTQAERPCARLLPGSSWAYLDESREGEEEDQMSHRCLAAAFTLIALVSLSAVPAVGQTQTAKADTPRTLDGRPDLSGVWDFRTLTPALSSRSCSATSPPVRRTARWPSDASSDSTPDRRCCRAPTTTTCSSSRRQTPW